MMADADRTIANRVFVNFAKALEAYQRQLVSRNAPFDKFVAGDIGMLATSEVRGLKLFVGKAGCIGCHSGPHLSDGLFHNIGVAQTGAHVPAADNGRFADITPLLASAMNVDGVFSDDRHERPTDRPDRHAARRHEGGVPDAVVARRRRDRPVHARRPAGDAGRRRRVLRPRRRHAVGGDERSGRSSGCR